MPQRDDFSNHMLNPGHSGHHLVSMTPCPVLSISFEVDVPTGKVGDSLRFERQRRELPRGSGGMLPRKFWQYNQNWDYINHILCLLQPFFSSKSQPQALVRTPFLAHGKAWDLVLWKCPRRCTSFRSCRSASTFYTSNERLTRLKLLKCSFT